MDVLRSYYFRSILGFVVVVVLVAVLAVQHVVPFAYGLLGQTSVWARGLDFGLRQSYVYALLFLVGEVVVRKLLWRISLRRLDLSGEWVGVTTYERALGAGPSGEVVQLPHSVRHSVLIAQDALHIAVAPGGGGIIGSWQSLAAELQTEADNRVVQLRIAYRVTYGDSDAYPHDTIGYEEMRVCGRDWKGRPTQMGGVFHHCYLRDRAPIYCGRTIYYRPGHEPKELRTQQPQTGVAGNA